MAQECEKLETCGFFIKDGEVKDLACRGFVNQYCRETKWTNAKERNIAENMARLPQMT